MPPDCPSAPSSTSPIPDLDEVRLGATSPSDPDAFILNFSYNNLSIKALLDCGASDCFLDQRYVNTHHIPTSRLDKPLRLRLFDGSYAPNGLITHFTVLPIRFATGKTTVTRFLISTLDPSVSAVLGYRWLRQHNPLIDWSTNRIKFRSPDSAPVQPDTLDVPSAPEPVKCTSPVSPPENPLPPEPKSSAPPLDQASLRAAAAGVDIRLVNAAAFAMVSRLSRQPSSILRVAYTESLDDPKLRAANVAADATEADELRTHVPPEYHDFLDVFSKRKADTLPEHRSYDHKIDLVDGAVPPLGPIYSLSEPEQIALRDYITEMADKKFIQQSKSPGGAPVLFVKKKDGSLRLCVDYRGLNKITRKDRYPLPLIPDLLDRLRTAKRFTKFDLRGAYNLVRIAPGDEWKTAFRTRYGSFEYQVMPFGLCNAPATFQRFMNEVFADLLDICVVVYLDDILVYSDDPAQHSEHVKEVLRRLRKHSLFAKPEKCEFSSESVEFLGFVCTSDGIKMDDAKVKTIQDWPRPRNVRDIQSFLGFANFYRRFIYNYSDIVIPLTRLTRKTAHWDWSSACQSAFDTLKLAFTSAPVLTHWQPELEPIIETDASDYAIAAIFSVKHPDNEIHPVAFHSRTLNPTELNYDTHDKELLAIFEAFQIWRHYLEGSRHTVNVVTDHKNLEYFSTTKMLTRRQARWSEFLSSFDLVIRFRPGKLGAKPDALTRRSDVYPKRGDRDYAQVNPQNLRPVFGSEQLIASLRATHLFQPALRAAALIDFESLQIDILEGLKVDISAQEQITKLSSSDEPSRWSLSESGMLMLDDRIYVPDFTPERGNLRLRVLQDKHDHPTAGHFGQTKTLELIRREYSWPNMRTDVQNFCKSCITCSRAKPARHKPYGLVKQLPIPSRPWHSISMDFIETLPPSSGFNSILVIVDRLSKQAVFIPTTDKCTAPDIAKFFVNHVFSKHGIPSHITSDRGSEFTSHFFRSLGSILGIKLHFTSGYHPEGDGQTERVNQTLEQYIRIYCNFQQDNWAELLPLAEFAYNNAPNATTGVSPFFANKGYHPSLAIYPERDITSLRARDLAVDLNELHLKLQVEIKAAQDRYQVAADRRRIPPPDIRIGDKVFVKSENLPSSRPTRKFADKNLGPFTVIGQHGANAFTIKLPDYLRRVHPVFHVSQLEPTFPNPFPNRTEPPPLPEVIDGENYYVVAEILDSKYDRRFRNCQLQYFVRWAGYEGTTNEKTWLPASEFDMDDEIVVAFHTNYPDKDGPARMAQ